jgi:hypothetical protein
MMKKLESKEKESPQNEKGRDRAKIPSPFFT